MEARKTSTEVQSMYDILSVSEVKQQINNDPTNEVIKSFDSMCMNVKEEISDEELFKQIPQIENCPICLLRMPSLNTGKKRMSCCGEIVCCGCFHEHLFDNGNKTCPICEIPVPTSKKKTLEMEKKRVEMNDAHAVYNRAYHYRYGRNGFTQSYSKALELWYLSGELGYTRAYGSIGYAYEKGEGVKADIKKAKHYYELAAIGGDLDGRCNLGAKEAGSGNMDRAVKHFMIAAVAGHYNSLVMIRTVHSQGHVTKQVYTGALRAYQEYIDKIKSAQRDKAAAFSEAFKYFDLTPEKEERKRHVAKLHDEALFRQPPRGGDCPICFQLMPILITGYKYMSCCGKQICNGCIYAPVYDDQGYVVAEKTCPFCRIQTKASSEEMNKRLKNRLMVNDPIAMSNKANDYHESQKYSKAFELWHHAGELGNTSAYDNIGLCYYSGRGIEVDKKKALHYWEIAAKQGNVDSRYELGIHEEGRGNLDRALKHHMIAVASGNSKSLQMVKKFYSDGYATKEEYTKALKSYKAYLDEIKSDQRDEAAASNIDWDYY